MVRQGPDKKAINWVPIVLIGIAIAYISLIIYIPAVNVFYQAFHKGFEPFLANLTRPDFINAAKVTISLALIAVPINTIFGLCAAWSIARHKFPGRTLLLSIIDLPLSISPVVAGLMIMLLYGRQGWFGGWFQDRGIDIVFAFPGMALATAFVSMPFVVREVIPVLEEAGVDQEEAARTLGASDWQIFWRVTLPNIRWGLMYGVLLTNARAMGEFGAVSVVSEMLQIRLKAYPYLSKKLINNTKPKPLFSAAVLLALLAAVTLVIKEILESKTRIKDEK